MLIILAKFVDLLTAIYLCGVLLPVDAGNSANADND